MSELLQHYAEEYRKAKDALAQAKRTLDWRKEDLKEALTEVYGEGKAKYIGTDGFVYSRTIAQVGGGFDLERFQRDQPELASRVTKYTVSVDEEGLEDLLNESPELQPLLHEYVIAPEDQVRLLAPREVKPEDLEDENAED